MTSKAAAKAQKAPEPACEACRDTHVCRHCRGERFRVLAGGVRTVCAECDGTGKCPACSTGAPEGERPTP